MKILVINGPNLNMLGKREVEIYGQLTLEDIYNSIRKKALELKFELEFFQSNCEGNIVNTIHEALDNIDGMIINPAAYTHTSVAIRDAISLFDVPIIEVHLSNIYARESFRKKSMIANVVNGHIIGLGCHGYVLALEAIDYLHSQ